VVLEAQKETHVELSSLAAEPHIWLTCGRMDSGSPDEKALDLRYIPNRSKRLSMVVSLLNLDLNQAVSHQLQYFADDCVSWLDTVSSDTSQTSREDLRLIGSRFLTRDDTSSDNDSVASDETVAEASSVECIVLEGRLTVAGLLLLSDSNLSSSASDSAD
jgi:hypothetical protein